MRICIPLLGQRVAPRCNIADMVMLLNLRHTHITSRTLIPLKNKTWIDFQKVLIENDADALVCGGIRREDRESIQSRHINIIDNVACTADEAIDALKRGTLGPGYGFATDQRDKDQPEGELSRTGPTSRGTLNPAPGQPREKEGEKLSCPDCLACRDRICLRGEQCHPMPVGDLHQINKESRLMLESAQDIAFEDERRLCRLAELVYLCLEMDYRRIGIAFCTELLEPTEILARVLRRFFEVYPVCCKVGGIYVTDPYTNVGKAPGIPELKQIACNPLGQAKMLNAVGTDLNVIVGLCVGTDCIFAEASQAPVTTLFVKDRSLANNPIGALYSDYYLKEATSSTVSAE